MKFRPGIALVALMIAAVGCGDDDPAAPTTGDLRIVTVTTGDDLDADGYTLTIDGAAGPAIGINATETLADRAPGPYVIELGDIAANCTVQGDNPTTATVVAGTTVTAQFDVTCEGPPANQPPVADAGPDQTVTDADDSGSEDVTLDGSGSTDSDGTISNYSWSENSVVIATGEMPTATFAVGVHMVTLTVEDDGGATATDDVMITVEAAPAGVSFAADILPYFEAGGANCVQCHGATNQFGGVRLDSYAAVLTDGTNGPLVVPGNSADASATLLPKVLADHNDGPDDAGFAVDLADWIDEGALDN